MIPAWQCNAVSAELNKTKKFTIIQYEIVAIDNFSALKVTEVGKSGKLNVNELKGILAKFS